MAENNIQVVIPAQASVEDMLALLVSEFAAASGMTADENNTFWVAANSIGLQFRVNGNYVDLYAIDYESEEMKIVQNMSYSTEQCLIYNKSVGGSVFAFNVVGNSTTDKFLRIVIAQDTTGVKRLIYLEQTYLYLWSPDLNYTKITITTYESTYCEFATLVKLPAVHARGTFSELYQVFSSPDITCGTDGSLYVGGGLYKVVNGVGTSGIRLAFRVA